MHEFDSFSAYEAGLESRLRKIKWLIPAITIAAGLALACGIWCCMYGFEQGCTWTIFIAAFLYHAVMIVTVHDGAHKSITRTSADSWIMAFFGGLVLLPVYPEPFRRFHLIHHAHPNADIDPLWPEMKRQVYAKSRVGYLLAELLPFGFLMVSVFYRGKRAPALPSQPRIRYGFMLFSFAVSAAVVMLVRMDWPFVLLSLALASVVAKFRHWCEHIGSEPGKESNTYWFPLGMGIGNHEVHHDHPHYSWFTLMIGLTRRRRETNPLKAFYRILADPGHKQYPERK
jgi:fatty acid desaturase